MTEPDFSKTVKIKIKTEGQKTSQGKTACLVILSGAEIGKVFLIDKPTMVIGREEGADIRLNESFLSRKHAQFITAADSISLKDLESTNGSFVNMDRVLGSEARALVDGDKILFGNVTTKFLFKDDIEAAYHEELYQLASHDGATDTYNKVYFLKTLNEKRHTKPLSLVMFDVDFFKKINDTYGHLAGDFILKELVKIVKGTLRKEDIFARYGGEEFILLMEKELPEATRVAERIRLLVANHKFIFADKEIACTISVGVYCVQDFSASIEQWIERVDKLLYKAKESGRNKVCF